jgi:NAD(P)-dependent dehydrogenase (short-subunit alcohol dehydrogenase family)
MRTILVSGAASGLGRAFVDAYIAIPDTEIIAIDRSPIDITSIKEPSRIKTHQVDVTSESSISALINSISTTPIHIFIHSAGIRGLIPSIEAQYPNDVARAETLDAMDLDTMLRTFHINTAGTFMLIRALLPNLRFATTSTEPAKVVIMGSRMGSVSYNTTGAAYAYRASKAGLNAVMKSFSIDVPEIVFAILHPGRVETGLVLCREGGAIEAGESVKQMMELIPTLDLGKSGGFFDRFGDSIGW